MYVSPYTNPPCLRLVQDVDDGVEEVTVRMYGIICKRDLPPVLGSA